METNEMNLNQETTMTAPVQQDLVKKDDGVVIPLDVNEESTAVGVVIGIAIMGVILGTRKLISVVKGFVTKDDDDEIEEEPKKKKVKKSKKPVKKVVEEVEDEDDEIEEEDE